MWAYKFLQKDTKLDVPKFKTFVYQNQDLLKLWYEDEQERLEDRISFAMRCLKYGAHLCILLVILISLFNNSDESFDQICSRR
jgi:hypothetical protein